MDRLLIKFLGQSLAAVGLLFWSGCGQSGHRSERAPSAAPARHASHNPEAGEHDHGHDIDSHTHIGPNGGRLIVLGEHEYHAELTIDSDSCSATVLLLDHCGRHPIGIEQEYVTLNLVVSGRPHQIRLKPEPQPSDVAPAASRFVGRDPILQQEQLLRGRINLVIGGKPYTGALAQRADIHTLTR